MTAIVCDASVLIDIEYGELTEQMFMLPFQYLVPDTLFEEELSQQHSHLRQIGLQAVTLTGKQVAQAYEFHQAYRLPSVNDMLCLVLAKDSRCALLTGDKALRQAAEEEGVAVHGTLWIVGEMLDVSLIQVAAANIAYKKMEKAGSRLPWVEVEKQLSAYNSKH